MRCFLTSSAAYFTLKVQAIMHDCSRWQHKSDILSFLYAVCKMENKQFYHTCNNSTAIIFFKREWHFAINGKARAIALPLLQQ